MKKGPPALRLLVQPYDEDENDDYFLSCFYEVAGHTVSINIVPVPIITKRHTKVLVGKYEGDLGVDGSQNWKRSFMSSK